ncbi:MAG TPA: slipin family protein [Acidobacteriota bacterium]|nr:slipin family protein [Acidobacteriota bacterium]
MTWLKARIRIRQHEMGLRFRYGNFDRLLKPGAYWNFGALLGISRIEVVNRLQTRFQHELLDLIARHEGVEEDLLVVRLAERERALLWNEGRLMSILGRGLHAFWRQPYELKVETFQVDDFWFRHPKLESIVAAPGSDAFLGSIQVESNQRGLVFRDGRLLEPLEAGLHVYWKQTGRVRSEVVDLREQVAEVAGQEIMTSDKVTLRVNLVVAYQVTDPLKAATVVSDYREALYREAQLALRAAVGTRKIDALLADKESVGGEVRKALSRRAESFGVAVRTVGLRDIILPGEMKTILNQVIEAQKQAEANLVRRREETAAARSQANTAKLLSSNPLLVRMKELESLQEILAGAKTTFILGKGDLSGQIQSLLRTSEKDD